MDWDNSQKIEDLKMLKIFANYITSQMREKCWLQVIILAGGLGTRLRPLTEEVPKSMVPILGKPFLEHQINLLRRYGVTDFVICVGYLGEKIREYFGDGSKFGVDIKYSEEKNELLGTAGALKKAEALVEDVFFVTYGDAYLILNYSNVMDYFLQFTKLGLMVVYKNFDAYDRSNVVVEGDFVKVYDKRIKFPGMFYIDFGVSVFKRGVLDLIPVRRAVDLEEIYQDLIRRRELIAYETGQRFYEIGSRGGLKEFEDLVKSGCINV